MKKIPLGLMLVAALGASAASTFSITVSNNKFTITRSGDTSAAETVRYRTIPLTAYPGQHFNSKSGTLAFAPGQTSTNVTVSTSAPSNAAFEFQTDSTRSYRFELLDEGGFLINDATRFLTTGISVPSSGLYSEKSATIDTTEFTVNDDGYKQSCNPRTFNRSSFYTDAANSYLVFLSAQLRMTLEFQAKEVDDAYEYFQLLANNTTGCDSEKDADKGDPARARRSRSRAATATSAISRTTTFRVRSTEPSPARRSPRATSIRSPTTSAAGRFPRTPPRATPTTRRFRSSGPRARATPSRAGRAPTARRRRRASPFTPDRTVRAPTRPTGPSSPTRTPTTSQAARCRKGSRTPKPTP